MPVEGIIVGVGLVAAGFVAGAVIAARRVSITFAKILHANIAHYRAVNMAIANSSYHLVKDQMTGPEYCERVMAISRRELGIELQLQHQE